MNYKELIATYKKFTNIPLDKINNEICEIAIENDPFLLEYIPDKYKSYDLCKKAFNQCLSTVIYIPDKYKSAEMCNYVCNKDPFLLNYFPDECITKELRNNIINKFSISVSNVIFTFENDIVKRVKDLPIR